MERKHTLLIVDDDCRVCRVLARLLAPESYELAFASEGAEAIEKAQELTPDMILTDVMMPGMDGFELCRRLRADPLLAEVPILMITALDDRASRLSGIQAGADEFIAKPFDTVELRARVRNTVRLGRYRKLLSERASLERANADLSTAYEATLEGWAKALELRNPLTEGHSRRLTGATVRLCRSMSVPADNLVHIRRGVLLHDIGKMAVPDSILLKPGPLSEPEWEVMRKHPTYARELLWPIDYLQPAIDIPYCHHEKWNGTGYPRGLVGEDIPQSARIFALLDVWDALCSDRPYRRRWPTKRAYSYIREETGRHFDPQVVDAFFKLDWDTLGDLPTSTESSLS